MVIAGLAVIGVLSPATPVAVEPTTTTSTTSAEVEPPIDPANFNIDQIARGEPLDWTEAMMLDDGYPMALLDHEGWIYLFSTAQPNWSGLEEGGLRGWRSADGESWEALGQVIPENYHVAQVSSTGQGLVVLEWRDGGLGVWESDNGFDWSFEEVPLDDLDPGQTVSPMAVGGSEAMLVVAGRTSVDVYRRVQEKLLSMGAENPNVFGWSVEVTGDEVRFPLYGPLGFPLVVLTADDLGLSSQEVELVVDDYQGQEPVTIIWTRTAEAGWQRGEIPGAYIETIRETPAGELIAFGYGRVGTTWTSRDGVDWEEGEASSGPYLSDVWRGRLIGPSDSGQADLAVSTEDGSWETMGPRDAFPNDFNWTMGATAAGPGGIAAVIMGWHEYGYVEPVEPPEPPRLTEVGATLTLDVEAGSYTLETNDGSTHTWSMSERVPSGVTVDLETASIIFSDPDTDDLLASFTISDITQAQNSYWAERDWSSPYQAFTFSPDGEVWTIQDGTTIGEGVEIMHLEVTETHVIAVGIDPAGRYDPTLSPGFGLWSAPIP